MPTPGPFAPTVTQHVAGTPTHDAHNNEIPSFTLKRVVALAEWPGSSLEDVARGDVVTADRVLLLPSATVVSELDEFTISDGIRYRVNGAPARFLSPLTGTAVTQVNLRRIT